jgi:selenide,water dikinase
MFAAADYPQLLLGLDSPDDAAVYRLDAERALVVTTDFFTPIVDDPYAYGSIAAANALSDVYATGGRPLLALNIAALPTDLPTEVTAAVFRGMAEKVREAGAVIAGGHTIQDLEPKVGLAVVGLAHPDRLLTKAAAKPGDLLVLTKPLGSGVITTAAKRDRAEAADVREAIGWMSRLNRIAGEAALAAGVRSATDVTGFGLLGHAAEVARSSGVTLQLEFDRLPWMAGARRYAGEGLFPGGSKKNQAAFAAEVDFEIGRSPSEQLLLFDAQTSGGLLLAISAGRMETFAAEMDRRHEPFWQIGAVEQRRETSLVVR